MTTSIVSRLGRAPEEGIKAPCKAATTANITLQGSGIMIDGVLINTSDRVLVKDQTLPAENGIYVAGPNAWERSVDMNLDDDVENAQYVADSNRSILYQISVTKPWSPGATPINFIPALAAMPPSITLTNSSPIDLVDVDVALKTGANDPATEPHLEYDFQAIQSKTDATTAGDLYLQPVGGALILQQSGLTPELRWRDSAAAADDGNWGIRLTGTEWSFHANDDAWAISAEILKAERAAGTGLVSVLAVGSSEVDQQDITAATLINIDAPTVTMSGVLGDYNGGTPTDDDILLASGGTFALANVDTVISTNAAVAANTAKVSNVPTALSLGTITAATVAITSDGAADDVVLPSFTTTDAGLAPGSGGGTLNFLRADGTWAVPPGSAGVGISGTPVDNQLAVWVSGTDIEGDGNLTWDGTTLTVVNPNAGASNTLALSKLGIGGTVLFSNASTGADTIAIHAFSGIANRTVPVLFVENDSATGTGIAAEIQQDASAPHLDLTGTNGEGIRFSNPQVSTNVNTLDWYEEGTFTPYLDTNILGDGQSDSQTYGLSSGTYVRIGKMVFFNIRLTMTSVGTLTGGSAAFIVFDGTLPNNTAEARNYPISVAEYAGLNKGADHSVSGYYAGINGAIALTLETNNASDPPMTISEVSDNGEMWINGFYEVNSA